MERHPDANRAFFEGMASVFRQWTTIELAIYHQWGGPNTQQKVDNLKNEVANMFLGTTKIYKDVRLCVTLFCIYRVVVGFANIV